MVQTFFSLLSGGMLGALAICGVRDIHWKYLRRVGMLCVALSAGLVAWQASGMGGAVAKEGPSPVVLNVLVGVLALGLMVVAPVTERRPGWSRVLCAIGALLGVSAGVVWWRTGQPSADARPLADGLVALGHVSEALLLGAVTTAWLLGHAYLTATKMTIAPLRRLCTLFLAAALLRLAFAAAAVGALALFGEGGAAITAQLTSAWLILLLRFGVGLLVLGLFAWMVLDCVRVRNTQSATGMLYFASVLAYVGELSSQYLVAEWGWPV